MNENERIRLESGAIEVGTWVVVTGPRYNGRKGKVLRINGSIATVQGNFGSWGHKGRVQREFMVEHLSLYSEDMEQSFPGEYH
jgi:hypothetical protein